MGLKVIIAGSTGMVGKGVLFECLKHPEVEKILVINRRTVDVDHPKLKEIIQDDFTNLSPIREELKGYDACFYCIGTVAMRINEQDYLRVTYDLAMHVARTLLEVNPGMNFSYISGLGSDQEGKSKIMRMRVKGHLEKDLLAMTSGKLYMFRPGYIQPKNGTRANAALYKVMYAFFSPFYPLLKMLFPKIVTSTDQVGLAMINVALNGSDNPILENREINQLAKST